MNPDRYYLADQEISLAAPAECQRLTQRLRQYLELRNVSILIGNGGSIPLGAPIITNTKQIKPELQDKQYKLKDDKDQATAISILDLLLPDNSTPVNLEYFLGVLGNLESNASILPAGTTIAVNNKPVDSANIRLLSTLLKKWLYLRCRSISDPTLEDLRHHRELLRRLLLRSTTLPRAKLFTTNYDLVLEHALDSLGIVYLDGFTGTIKRNRAALIGVDSPIHFDFDHFVTTLFEEQLAREAAKNPQLRTYIGTLQLRLDQARQDPRYAFLFKVQPFAQALASFLRLLFGEFPAKHFREEGARAPWADYYEERHGAVEQRHQVTIIDLSQLASEVLENITALIGRLILEFLQRCPDRGSFPVVLVLEEAHHYIAAEVTTDRQRRARDVFEKIAKEGRKFGLSLVVASQRPSELSRTVLAQCNSFIVHRIQNPDDQDYFRSVISGINRELLDQLPALPQQHAIVLGDCVRLPLQVRIKDVSPRPNSFDPEFSRVWADTASAPPDFEAICDRWQALPVARPAEDEQG